MCCFARFAYGFALGRVKCWSGAKSDVVGMFPLDDVVVLVCGVHMCWYVLPQQYVDAGCDVWAVRVFELMGLTCLGFRPGGFNAWEYAAYM